MIADGVVQLQTEVLFGLVVEIEERNGALGGNGKGVEDVVSPVDGKIGLESAALLEGHVGADDAVELGLKMRVGNEEKGERPLRRCGRGEYGRGNGRGEAGGSEQGEELSAAG